MKKRLTAFHNWKTRTKLLVIYTIAGIFPILLLGIGTVSYAARSMVQFQETQLVAYVQNVKKNLFNLSGLCFTTAKLLRSDDGLRTLLTTEYECEEEAYDACRQFTIADDYAGNYTEISDIHIYHNNQTLVDYGRYSRITKEIRQTDWYEKALKNSGTPFWYIGGIEGTDSPLCLVCYTRIIGTENFMIIVVGVSENYLNTVLNSGSYDFLLGLNFDTTAVASNRVDIGNALPFEVNGKTSVSDPYITEYHGKRVLAADVSVYGVNTNDQFQFAAVADVLTQIYRTVRSFILILIIAVTVPLLMILFFTRSYSRRVVTLRNEMEKVAKGNLDIIDTFEGEDELGELFRDMKETIRSIQTLKDQVWQDKLTERELENQQQQMRFELLASQINPHFLFNTLEVIRMRAALDEDRELTNVVLQLGKLLRSSLENKNEPVTLDHEKKYLESYLDIQRFRFQDKIVSQIHVQPQLDTSQIEVLPLLLQPLVENAFSHGLAGVKGNGRVYIDILSRGEVLMMTVWDNGVGMTAEKLAELQKKMESPELPFGRSIGICNVHNRIKLYYGAEYGISISSKPEEGTTVTVRIPKRAKGGLPE